MSESDCDHSSCSTIVTGLLASLELLATDMWRVSVGFWLGCFGGLSYVAAVVYLCKMAPMEKLKCAPFSII